MLKNFSTILLSSSLAFSMIGLAPVKTLADEINTQEDPCNGNIDCFVVEQEGDSCFLNYYYNGSLHSSKKISCLTDEDTIGSGNSGNNGNNPLDPCRVCNRPFIPIMK